jgi:hypothetical protein
MTIYYNKNYTNVGSLKTPYYLLLEFSMLHFHVTVMPLMREDYSTGYPPR